MSEELSELEINYSPGLEQWLADEQVGLAFAIPLARVSDRFSFTPFWWPPFQRRRTQGDCCHLNGGRHRRGEAGVRHQRQRHGCVRLVAQTS